jgi:hypothetical protein
MMKNILIMKRLYQQGLQVILPQRTIPNYESVLIPLEDNLNLWQR